MFLLVPGIIGNLQALEVIKIAVGLPGILQLLYIYLKCLVLNIWNPSEMNSSYMNVYNDLSLPYDRVEFHRLPQTHKRSYDLPSLLLSRMLFLGLLLLRFLLMFVFRRPSRWPLFDISPGCIPCKVYAEDTPILTIDSIVICQTHAEDFGVGYLKCTLDISELK